jgi:hypothetical protein
MCTFEKYVEMFTELQIANKYIAETIRESINFRHGYYVPYSEFECKLLSYAIEKKLDIMPDISNVWKQF